MRSRLRFLPLAAVAAALALLAGCTSAPGPTPTATSTHRNIVFILTDDLSNNLLAYMPHVQALQKTGVTFSNYSVTDSLCCPSRSSIFSGRFPHDTQVFTNGGSDGGFHVFQSNGEEKATFATALQSAGYRTAMMGKYLNGYLPATKLDGSQNYVPPGWSEWDVAGNGYPEFNYDLNENHKVVHYGSAPKDYLTDVLSGKGSSFITSSAKSGSPFMLEIATFAPHAPYTPAPSDANSFAGTKAPRTAAFNVLPANAPAWLANRPALNAAQIGKINQAFRKRVQDVQSVDRMIASLEATLQKSGQASNTDFVFSSDNGYHMGDFRLEPGKMTAYDTDIHVPLIMSGPGIATGRTISQVAENIDIAPTFESIGGATTPADVDGHSLTPLLEGGTPATWRTTALIEHHGPDTDPTDPDYPPKGSGNPPSYNALRTSSYTYVEYADGSTEFYDRTSDPLELNNIAGSLSSADVATLHATLLALTGCHDSTACWAAGSRPVIGA